MIELTRAQWVALNALRKTESRRTAVRPGSKVAEILAPLADAGLVVPAGWIDRDDPKVLVWLTDAGGAAARVPMPEATKGGG